jgi:hypothetical protein
MKKTTAIEIYKALSPLPVTKFSAENQTALMQNYLKLHDVAKAHDDAIRTAVEKFRSEGIEDEEELKAKLGEVLTDLFNEEVEVDIKKIDRTQFLAEATKAGVEITLEQIGILEPMFN